MERVKAFAKLKFPSLFYWLYGLKYRRLRHLSPREIFTEKYHENSWRDQESHSGPGSNLENTQVVRSELPGMLERLGSKSLLDIPCGDFYWMKEIHLDLEQYIGADIVQELVDTNKQRFGREDRKFVILDITRDDLPMVDVILCRDCLVHFSYEDINRALVQIKRSESTYLLTTTYFEKEKNLDIMTGQWRPLNLEKAPFNFPPPEQMIEERSTEQDGYCLDKGLALWRITSLDIKGYPLSK